MNKKKKYQITIFLKSTVRTYTKEKEKNKKL